MKHCVFEKYGLFFRQVRFILFFASSKTLNMALRKPQIRILILLNEKLSVGVVLDQNVHFARKKK